MDGNGKLGTFLLGVIAAVVLYMLWKKDGQPMAFAFPSVAPGQAAPSQPCGFGCASGVAAPYNQSAMLDAAGIGGFITAGTPPLNAVTGGQGATSFYSNTGPTPDASFTFSRVARNISSVGSPVQPAVMQNVPGSASTPATVTPTRATQPVPTYAETGFQQRYNIVGIPLRVLQTGYIQ